jgi:hypothetical protein
LSLRPRLDPRLLLIGEDVSCASPAVVGGGMGFLVGWEHGRDQSPWIDVHGRLVWSLAADGFKSGDLSAWDAASF